MGWRGEGGVKVSQASELDLDVNGAPSSVLHFCNFGVFNVPRRFFVAGAEFSFPPFPLGVAADLHVLRFEAPVRGVLVLASAFDAAGARGLGVTADLRGTRFLAGDSPLTPRARRTSTRGFTSDGTKMLVVK